MARLEREAMSKTKERMSFEVEFVPEDERTGRNPGAWRPVLYLRPWSGSMDGALRVFVSEVSGLVSHDYHLTGSASFGRVAAGVRALGKIAAYEWNGRDYVDAEKVVAHYADECQRLGWCVTGDDVLGAAARLGYALDEQRGARRLRETA